MTLPKLSVYRPLLRGLATASLLAGFAFPASADTYQQTIAPGANVFWTSATWTGGSGTYPSTGDNAVLTRGNGNNSVLRMAEGNNQINALSYTGGTNQLRLRNESPSAASILEITSSLTVEQGLLILDKDGSGQLFDVRTASAIVKENGILQISRIDAGISFSSKTTSIEQGGTLQVAWNPSGAISFGDVTNHGNFYLAGGATNLTATYQLSASSLSGGENSLVSTDSAVNAATKITLEIGSTGTASHEYAGLISDGPGTVAIAKAGTNIQIFSHANTYSGGTVIEGGILSVTNETGSGLGTGAVEVKTGGLLAGNGMVASHETITVSNGGAIAPGGAQETGFSTLHLQKTLPNVGPILEMEEGASFTFKLGLENQSDSIEFLAYQDGDLVLNSTLVHVSRIEEGTFTLFTFKDASGDFVASNLIDGLRLGSGFNGYSALFIYHNDPLEAGYGQITLQVAAIPEPATWALVCIGGLWVLTQMRRRKLSLATLSGAMLMALPICPMEASASEKVYTANALPDNSIPKWEVLSHSNHQEPRIVDGNHLQASVADGSTTYYRIGRDAKGVAVGDADAWRLKDAAFVEFRIRWKSENPDYEVFRIELSNGGKRWAVPFYGNSVGIKHTEVEPGQFDVYQVILKDGMLTLRSEKQGLISMNLKPFGDTTSNQLLFGSVWNRENQSIGGHAQWELEFIRWTTDPR